VRQPDYFVQEAITAGAPTPGDRIVLSDTAQIEAVHEDHPDAHMDLAVRLFGPKLRAVQLVWTDRGRGTNGSTSTA
jgi:hypothetical protein